MLNKSMVAMLTENNMNERIRELMIKAGTDTSGKWLGVEHAEQFAQLIVRECVDIANKQFSAASGLDDRDCWTAAEIKKHFGVEQ
jgi:hypothetical protein